MKAGPYTITQAEAIRRTKRLLASCEPKTAETDFAHRLLEYFTLSVDKGYPVFLQHLIDCYTDKNGADIGEPPDTYENFGWVYPQLLMANLEEKLGQSRISGQVKDDVRQMLSQATNSADLAEEFLKIQALAGAEIGTETLMILHCFAFEIQKTANGPGVLEQLQKCASGADKGAALPGWRLNKLSLKSAPNGKKPGVFAYGRVAYTVPGGDAWEAVCRLIDAGAFDGHGLPMKTPGDLFRRGHRAFFSERMGRNESGWFIKTR